MQTWTSVAMFAASAVNMRRAQTPSAASRANVNLDIPETVTLAHKTFLLFASIKVSDTMASLSNV